MKHASFESYGPRVTESDFYYRSMLQANEWRLDKDTAPSTALLMACAATAYELERQQDVRDVAKQEAYREALIKTAAVAMRLATRS